MTQGNGFNGTGPGSTLASAAGLEMTGKNGTATFHSIGFRLNKLSTILTSEAGSYTTQLSRQTYEKFSIELLKIFKLQKSYLDLIDDINEIYKVLVTSEPHDRRTGWDNYEEIEKRNSFVLKFLIYDISWQVLRIMQRLEDIAKDFATNCRDFYRSQMERYDQVLKTFNQ